MKKIKQTPVSLGLSLKLIAFLPLVISIIFASYFYYQYQKTKKLLQDPTEKATQEIKNIVAQVEKLIMLPKDELPTIATVTDKTKLNDQPFFAKVENGDRLLVYKNNKKAYIYRPSINKIIDVGPVNTSELNNNQTPNTILSKISPTPNSLKLSPSPKTSTSTPTPTIINTPTPTVSKKVTVAVFNGTKTAGWASLTQQKIEENMSQIEVIKKGDAKNDYSEILIVDINGNKSTADQLANLLSGKVVSSLPSGELSSSADIVILLGKQN